MNNAEREEAEKKSKDLVNHPPHYTNGDIECIDAMKAMSDDAKLPSSHAHYCWQTIFKYI